MSIFRELFKKGRGGRSRRVFALDDKSAIALRKIAQQQQRGEEEILDDVIEAGLDKVQGTNAFERTWDSLSFIEQEITTLLGLGQSSYEIAAILNISYDTV